MYLSANKVKEYRDKNRPRFCPILHVPFTRPTLDHDHQTGLVRGVIDLNANNLIGAIENKFLSYCSGNKKDLPQVLRNIADYLEKPKSDVLHPVGLNQLVTRFKNHSKDKQIKILSQFIYLEKNKINSCNNQKERIKLYRTLLKKFYETKTTKHRRGVQCSKDTIQ